MEKKQRLIKKENELRDTNRIYKITLLLFLINVFSLHAQYTIDNAFPNLAFTSPVDFQSPDDGSNRIFVVEQRGVIKTAENIKSVSVMKNFLNIADSVDDGGEKGLLGLAFHPDYPDNGYFYVNYTKNNPLETIISRFKVSGSNPDSADPESELILMRIAQPYENHNGGQIAFGPDGMLYIALGDGGSRGDPGNRAQKLDSLLGKILRINVDSVSPPLNYSIPPDNPFMNSSQGYREEIFAYGLRNPWRFSFDFPTAQLWCGDVGQGDWEEINIIEKGKNYGWRCYEGNHEYNLSACNDTGFIFPVWEYSHSEGRSITGGYIYRGSSLPELYGRYIYADFISGKVWALNYDGINPPENEFLLTAPGGVSSFGVDRDDELYLCSFDGRIYKIIKTVTGIGKKKNTNPDNFILHSYPNPFNPLTKITFTIPEESKAAIEIFDLLGNRVSELVNEIFQAGSYEEIWDASQFASGIYIISMRVETTASERIFQFRRKVLLLK